MIHIWFYIENTIIVLIALAFSIKRAWDTQGQDEKFSHIILCSLYFESYELFLKVKYVLQGCQEKYQ